MAPSSRKRFHVLSIAAFLLLLVIIPITVITSSQRQVSVITSLQRQDLQSRVAGSLFVTKSGSNLMVNGSPLRLIGYNWHWMGVGCGAPTDTQIDTTFSQIKTASHGNVVKTAFYQSGSNKCAYTGFDSYIAYAKKYGLYIVPMLVNHWTSCEPSIAKKPSSWYQSGYKLPNDGYPLSFRDYAIKLARHYANEPTIAFWQDAKLSAGFNAGRAGYIIWNKGSQSVQDDIGPGDPTESVLANMP